MDQDLAGLASKWQIELELAKKTDKDWLERGKKIVKRYRDERSGVVEQGKRYNILWSNIRTLLPAVYAKKPQAEVSRRFKDADPVGRVASEILQRSLQFEIDQYSDYDSSIKNAVLDRLLCGRGIAWVRFEPAESPEAVETGEAQAEPQIYEDIENVLPYETSPVDYVYWEDFRHSPARTWEEVTWVARRVYMARKEGEERFGEAFKDVPLSHVPLGIDEMKKEGAATGPEADAMKKAKVWEIWDKSNKQVYWYAEGYPKLLDARPDPLGLDTFFPCPKPLFATLSTDTLVPVPDYSLYQDQARELDELTQRIWLLVKAVKVVGVYDASQTGVQRMLNEGVDNTLIPVDTWAQFGEKGGLKGTVDFLPLEMVLTALNGLYQAREAAKQVIYEVTGLSDIIRGASVASETATAQQIKSQYASLRLKEMQMDVARFASDLLRIKAQIMSDLYRPETLIAMSGIQGTQEIQYIQPAIQLLKSDPVRQFRISVASDSLVLMDEQQEKQDRMEFLQTVSGFLKEAVQAPPELAPLLGEILMFGVRSFRSGTQLEAAMESFISQATEQAKQPKQPQPDPEMMKLQANQQLEQAKLQATAQSEQQRMQMEVETARQKAEFEAMLEQQRIQHEQAIEMSRQAHEKALKQMELDAKLQAEREKAELDASTKILVAQISAQQMSESQAQAEDAANKEVVEQLNPLNELAAMHGQMLEGIGQVVQALKAPKKRILERDPSGRAVGVVEVTE